MRNWLRSREYKSGTGWCLWRWTEIPSDYILRLHVFKTPWFAVCLHWINGPDAEPHLHDHPVSFLSIILRGCYREKRVLLRRRMFGSFKRAWWNFVRACREDRHRIISVSSGGCLTLCLMGPKRQDWGFHTPGGWVYWKDYNREKYAGN